MSDYTPTTEEVRNQYVFSASVIDETRFVDPTQGEAEFDRWLAEVKAEAWEEGESDGRWNEEHQAMIERGNREAIANPYRQGEEQ